MEYFIGNRRSTKKAFAKRFAFNKTMMKELKRAANKNGMVWFSKKTNGNVVMANQIVGVDEVVKALGVSFTTAQRIYRVTHRRGFTLRRDSVKLWAKQRLCKSTRSMKFIDAWRDYSEEWAASERMTRTEFEKRLIATGAVVRVGKYRQKWIHKQELKK